MIYLTIKNGGIENEEGDDSIRDLDEIRQGSGTMELQQVNTSTMQQRTLIQILCVAILTVLAIITLIVSLLRQEMPTDLPLTARSSIFK